MTRGRRMMAGSLAVLACRAIMAVAPVIPYLLERGSDNLFLGVQQHVFWIDLEFYLIRAAPGVLLALLAVHALVRPAWRAWRWICASAAMLSILATVAAFVVAQDFTDRPQKYEVVMDFVVTFGVGALVASLGTVLVWTAGRPASDQAGTTQVEPV